MNILTKALGFQDCILKGKNSNFKGLVSTS